MQNLLGGVKRCDLLGEKKTTGVGQCQYFSDFPNDLVLMQDQLGFALFLSEELLI